MKLTSSMTALLIGGGAAAAASCYVFAQGFLGNSLSDPKGTEIIEVRPLTPTGIQAATAATVVLNQIRNANGYLLFSSATSAASTITLTTATADLLIPTTPATLTVVLPGQPAAFDGELISVCNVTGSSFSSTTTEQIVAGTSSTISDGSSTAASISFIGLTANNCIAVIFDATTNLWYRTR